MGKRFSQWAIRARMTDDPVGDFIGDFRSDKRAPSDFESLARLRLYLKTKNACPEAIEAAAGAWRRYQSWRSCSHTDAGHGVPFAVRVGDLANKDLDNQALQTRNC